ncbi:hypothetical protein HK098_007915 [Nowakowskiella sp. JEL0407]|nr:hypothetical protein HK098_007915 [Nowakowskiella sp. JEL0407]
MEYRFLGNSGLKVSCISLGSWMTYGDQIDDEVAEECLKVAYENGINYFDTAEGYAKGKSEIVLGNALKKFGWKRSKFAVSTKIYWGGSGINERGLSRKHIIEGLKGSLERLKLEYVDIVFAHRPDNNTPMEEIVRAFNWVIEKGWAPQYNLLKRERMEYEYLPLFKQYNMGTTIFSPLSQGILTGKYFDGVDAIVPDDSRLGRSSSKMILGFKTHFIETRAGVEKMKRARLLLPIAERLGATVSQLALAWTLKNKNVSSAIIGASKPHQVYQNVQALKFVPLLTSSIMEEIDVLFPKPALDVDRY